MKKYLIILLIFLLTVPAMSKTLTGGVVYTVESARKAAFDGIEYEISMEPFKKYLQDPGFISAAKKEGGRPKVSKKGRWVTFFQDGEYGVKYKSNLEYVYYYSRNGQLKYIEKCPKNCARYPLITKKYDINGRLSRVFFRTAEFESFVYTIDKELVAHWKNEFCYDKNGLIIAKRKI